MTVMLARGNLPSHAASIDETEIEARDRIFYARLAEATELEKQADEIESMTLSNEADRVHLRDFAKSRRDAASRIRGELGRIADREARQNEETTSGYRAWRPV